MEGREKSGCHPIVRGDHRGYFRREGMEKDSALSKFSGQIQIAIQELKMIIREDTDHEIEATCEKAVRICGSIVGRGSHLSDLDSVWADIHPIGPLGIGSVSLSAESGRRHNQQRGSHVSLVRNFESYLCRERRFSHTQRD